MFTYIPETHPLSRRKQKQMAGRCFVFLLLVWSNVLISVLIIVLNKHIYTRHGISSVTLTCLHFVVTTVCVLACERFGVFDRKSLPITDLLPQSLTYCAYVVFTNISLQTNTVATYLVFKMAMTPTVVALETFWFRRKFSNGILLTLVSSLVFWLNTPCSRFILAIVVAAVAKTVAVVHQTPVVQWTCMMAWSLLYQLQLHSSVLR